MQTNPGIFRTRRDAILFYTVVLGLFYLVPIVALWAWSVVR